MLTRELRQSRPLYQLSKFSKGVLRFMLTEAWENGNFHCVLDKGEIQLEHVKDAVRVFQGGLLSVSSYVTDDEKVSVSIYR